MIVVIAVDLSSMIDVDENLPCYRPTNLPPELACSDGNGRLGRLLIMLQLYDAGLLPGPYLYLSACFKQFGQAYREKLPAEHGVCLERLDSRSC